MSSAIMKKKSKATRGDDGQANNQRALANIDRRLKLVEDRTVSNRNTLPLMNKVAQASRQGALKTKPEAFLTEMEAHHHACLKAGKFCDPLVNHNIEPSLIKQHYTGVYQTYLTVAPATSEQITVISVAGNSQPGSDSPKAFKCHQILAAGTSAVQAAIPGPASSSGLVRGCVLRNTVSAIDSYVVQTTSAVAGYCTIVPPVTECPFTTVLNDGRALRWQIGTVRIRAVNQTRGDERGGVAYVMSPTNALTASAGNQPNSYLTNKGIWKLYRDMNVGTTERPVSVFPRSGLSAFHYADSNTSISLGNADVFICFSNPTNATQSVELLIEIDWVLSGNSIRGIGKPHLVPNSVQDRVNEAHEAMRAANVLPTEQGKDEHVPAALALASSPALQAMHAKSTEPRVVKESTFQQVKKLAGKHLPKLVEAGFSHLVSSMLG